MVKSIQISVKISLNYDIFLTFCSAHNKYYTTVYKQPPTEGKIEPMLWYFPELMSIEHLMTTLSFDGSQIPSFLKLFIQNVRLTIIQLL